jgi:hypothetical protein
MDIMNASDSGRDDGAREIVLSRVWQEGLHAPELRTIDGRRVSIVYRGVWTHSNGPDFRDALLEIDGRLVSGAVELHLRSSDWRRHGHDADPAYNAVILHVVLHDDSPASPGARIPTVEIEPFLIRPLDDLLAGTLTVQLGALGSATCLPTLAGGRPELVREALRRKGWERLAGKHLRFAQELEAANPGEVLYRGLLDGLGLVSNRRGMAAVGAALPLAVLESSAQAGRHAPAALLLGVGGFLPLSPLEAEYAGLAPDDVSAVEAYWNGAGERWALTSVPVAEWSLNRVRPANHPVRRLSSLASLVMSAGEGGLLGAFLAGIDDAPAAWTRWLASARPALGDGRLRQLATNILAPFLGAYAEATEDADLAEHAALIYERLPGKIDDTVARTALRQIVGETRFPITTALEEQGLHQIGRFGCAHLRCFECPIALLAARYEGLGPGSLGTSH